MAFPDFSLEYRLRGSANATASIKLVTASDLVLAAGVWSAWTTIAMSRFDPATEDLFHSDTNTPLDTPALDHLLVIDMLLSDVTISPDALYTLDLETKVDGGSVVASTAELYGTTWRLVARQEDDLTIAVRGQAEDVAFKQQTSLAAFTGPRPTQFIIGDNIHFGPSDDIDSIEVCTDVLWELGGNALGIGGGGWHNTLGEMARPIYQAAGFAFIFDGTTFLGTPKGGYHGWTGQSGGYEWPAVNPNLVAWADEQLAGVLSAGWTALDVRHFHYADEVTFAAPKHYLEVIAANDPIDQGRFHSYLQAQGLTLADIGYADWSTVWPTSRSTVVGAHGSAAIEARRLFYWSARFWSYTFSEQSERVNAELQRVFPNTTVSTTWNNEGGFLYKPGSGPGENPKTSANALIKPDWFEFGGMGGSSLLWTEDWFGDGETWKWSFYGALLRSAGRERNLPIGGYVVGRVSGQVDWGYAAKVLALVAQGCKKLQRWTYGPVWNQAGNGYSGLNQHTAIYLEIQRAMQMLGEAEADGALYLGVTEPARVAILHPTASYFWNEIDKEIPTGQEVVNFWDRELMYLYRSLVAHQIPCDFINERGISNGELNNYDVLCVTEPNIPLALQTIMVEWTEAGGTLISTTNAGSRDEYDSAIGDGVSGSLDDMRGIVTRSAGSPDLEIEEDTYTALTITPTGGNPPLLGSALPNFRGQFHMERATWAGDTVTRGVFPGSVPAVVERAVGSGWSLHFSTNPGHAAIGATLAYPAIQWLLYGVMTLGGVTRQVTSSIVKVETQVLLSVSGTTTRYAVCVFWRGTAPAAVTLALQVVTGDRDVVVTSVVDGVLTPTIGGSSVSFALTGARPVDVVTLVFTTPAPSPIDVAPRRSRMLLLGVS